MARMNEQAVREMLTAKDMSHIEKRLKEDLEVMKKETHTIQLEYKAVLKHNDKMKNSFAQLLEQFQDYVNGAEASQEQMRATIKRLSIENQRFKVN